MAKAKKSPLVTSLEEDFIYLIHCKNRHGQNFTVGIEATMAKAEVFKDHWISNRMNDHYWLKNEDGSLAVEIEKKPVISNPIKKI